MERQWMERQGHGFYVASGTRESHVKQEAYEMARNSLSWEGENNAMAINKECRRMPHRYVFVGVLRERRCLPSLCACRSLRLHQSPAKVPAIFQSRSLVHGSTTTKVVSQKSPNLQLLLSAVSTAQSCGKHLITQTGGLQAFYG